MKQIQSCQHLGIQWVPWQNNTLRKSLQTTSASPCRRYMLLTSSVLSATSKQCFELTSSVLSTTSKQCFEQPAASFLVCSLIFIEYKNIEKRNQVQNLVPFEFLDYIIPKKRAAIPTAKSARMIEIGDTFFLSNHMQRKVRRSPINPGINEFN